MSAAWLRALDFGDPLLRIVGTFELVELSYLWWADREQFPYELGGLQRSPARVDEWLAELQRAYEARARVEAVLHELEAGRCSPALAGYVVEAATAELRRALPPGYDESPMARIRRARERRGPEITSGRFEITPSTLEAISRAHERDRWHVALRLLMSSAIHVVWRSRPSAYELVAKARELAGGAFPAGDVDADLAGLAGVRLGYLTDKPRGGGGKRSIGSVLDELRRKHAPCDEDLIVETVRANPGIAGDVPISKLLGIRRQRVTAARIAAVAAGRIENRAKGRRVALFVPNGPSLPRP